MNKIFLIIIIVVMNYCSSTFIHIYFNSIIIVLVE
jgi:hypothetical protein